VCPESGNISPFKSAFEDREFSPKAGVTALKKGELMAKRMFVPEESLLLVVDVQERLWPHISNKDQVRDRCRILMEGARLLGVPVIVSEQYPKGLGPTLGELLECRGAETPLCTKNEFGCFANEALAVEVEKTGRRQLVVCGIEAHVCVLQTVMSALERGYQAGVVADAVGSRDEANRQLALFRMRDAGAVALSSEMILFEWMGTARHPAFKAVSQLIK
jgi:nicotinamidase-related amidase